MTPRHQAIPPQLLDWLLFDVGNTSDLPSFLDALGNQLCEAGLAVWRIALNIPTLHPEQRAYTFIWTQGETTGVTPRAHGIEQTTAFLASPFRLGTGSGKPFRRRLDAPQPELPALEEFREEGGTDYFIVPLRLLLRTAAMSFVTRHTGGFDDAALAALQTVAAASTPQISLRSIRLSAINLLNTYVRRGTGEHPQRSNSPGRGRNHPCRDLVLRSARFHPHVGRPAAPCPHRGPEPMVRAHGAGGRERGRISPVGWRSRPS